MLSLGGGGKGPNTQTIIMDNPNSRQPDSDARIIC